MAAAPLTEMSGFGAFPPHFSHSGVSVHMPLECFLSAVLCHVVQMLDPQLKSFSASVKKGRCSLLCLCMLELS